VGDLSSDAEPAQGIDPIREAELLLRDAMIRSDVAALDALLADDLIFTDQAGRRLSKSDDLAVHQSGDLKLTHLEFEDTEIRHYGTSAVVSVQVILSGSYLGEPFKGKYRYTRVWIQRGGKWQVGAAHCSVVA
jgi:ketosteroid isomerase-like protein